MNPFDPQQNPTLQHPERTTDEPSELRQLKFALDQSAIVAVTDARGIITFANEKFCEISQYSIEELLGKSHKVVNSGFHPKSFFEQMWRTISSGNVWSGEIKNRAKNGSYYWVQTSIIPFLNEGLRPYQYVSIRFDITKQKEAEDKLAKYAGELESNLKTLFESEENFKQLFNSSFDGTIVHKNGFILNANQAASEIFETPTEKLLGGQLLNFLPEETHKLFIDTFEANKDVHFEAVLSQKGRSRAFFKISSKQLLYKGVKASLLTLRDETEQRILQSQLAQQERLASVGFLASGLAHEIGTPLGIIRGRAEYLSLYPENQKSVRSNMEIIVNQIDRISKLIYSLLNLARKDSPETITSVSFNGALEDVGRLLSSTFTKEGISTSFTLADEVRVLANKSQLEQILLNLLINALHAIKTRAETDKETKFQVSVQASQTGPFWEICLNDNGCGISNSNLPHIFEPFFTTKAPGSGTGLGLSIAQQIIFSWHGNIRCESKVNQGTSFFIRIPKA